METKNYKKIIVQSLFGGMIAYFTANIITFLIKWNATNKLSDRSFEFNQGRFFVNDEITGYDVFPTLFILFGVIFLLKFFTSKSIKA